MTVYAITDTKKRENRDCAYLSSNYPNADREHWFARIVGRSVVLSSLLLFRLLPRPRYLLIAVSSAVPSFRRSVYF